MQMRGSGGCSSGCPVMGGVRLCSAWGLYALFPGMRHGLVAEPLRTGPPCGVRATGIVVCNSLAALTVIVHPRPHIWTAICKLRAGTTALGF